jgi:hypothetical protein
MTIPQHVRDNYEATDAALIRFNGLAYALEIVADEIPDSAPKSANHWHAFYALMNELVEKHDTIMHLRSQEWAGLGGSGEGLTDDEIRRARGEPPAEPLVSVPFLRERAAE